MPKIPLKKYSVEYRCTNCMAKQRKEFDCGKTAPFKLQCQFCNCFTAEKITFEPGPVVPMPSPRPYIPPLPPRRWPWENPLIDPGPHCPTCPRPRRDLRDILFRHREDFRTSWG